MILRAIFLMLVIPAAGMAQGLKVLIPDFGVVQYAGSIGFGSIGAGYDIFNDRTRMSFHYGHVPSPKGGPLHILSTKIFYEPLIIKPWKNVVVQPADIGFMISYTAGEAFNSSWPNRYPDGYYWWRTSLRLHLAIESSVTILRDESRAIKSIAGYVEFNTNELYFLSYATNRHSLDISDVVKIGLGTRLSF